MAYAAPDSGVVLNQHILVLAKPGGTQEKKITGEEENGAVWLFWRLLGCGERWGKGTSL